MLRVQDKLESQVFQQILEIENAYISQLKVCRILSLIFNYIYKWFRIFQFFRMKQMIYGLHVDVN
jgi:hypothetical protein